MNKSKLILIVSLVLSFLLGFLLGKTIYEGPLPRNSGGSCPFRIGDQVKVKEGKEIEHFYNHNCERMTVLGLKNVDGINLVWVRVEDCLWSINRTTMTVTFSQEELEKAK